MLVIFLSNVGLIAQEVPNPAGLSQPRESGREREYVIGTNDQLAISEWQSQQFTTQGTVRTDGKITIPYLGDIQAAGLKVSSFRKNLEVLLQKYLKEPMVNLTVRTSGTIRVTITVEGMSTQETELPRETKLLQILRELVPNLRQLQPPPDLANLKVIGSEGEEITINGRDLLAGKSLESNIRLEWGDQIYIPSQAPPTPAPADQIQTERSAPSQQATFTSEEFEEFLQQYPPEVREMLQTLAKQPDEQTYTIDLTALSEEQRQQLGAEALQGLEQYVRVPQQEHFTDITPVAININLTVAEALEAYLAIPGSEPGTLPDIGRFREGDLVQPGATEDEDIFLEKIIATQNKVILRQGEKREPRSLPSPFTQVKLSGILDLGTRREASFSGVKDDSIRPRKQRLFQEGEEIEDGLKLAQISKDWVLLQKKQEMQLLLLRDSLNRASPTPTPAPIPTRLPEISGENPLETDQMAQTARQSAMKSAMPPPLQAVDSLSSLFFATPLF